MADYAPNYTARLRLRYTTLGKRHAMTFRKHPTSTGLEPMLDGIEAFFTALRPLMWQDWTLLGVDYAGENSDVFLPVAAPVILPGPLETPGIETRPAFISFVGRGASGSKARLFLYGTGIQAIAGGAPNRDWRLTTSENAVVSNAVAALQNIPDQSAIDRSAVTWYPYVNMGYNAYYQRKQRNG